MCDRCEKTRKHTQSAHYPQVVVPGMHMIRDQVKGRLVVSLHMRARWLNAKEQRVASVGVGLEHLVDARWNLPTHPTLHCVEDNGAPQVQVADPRVPHAGRACDGGQT